MTILFHFKIYIMYDVCKSNRCNMQDLIFITCTYSLISKCILNLRTSELNNLCLSWNSVHAHQNH